MTLQVYWKAKWVWTEFYNAIMVNSRRMLSSWVFITWKPSINGLQVDHQWARLPPKIQASRRALQAVSLSDSSMILKLASKRSGVLYIRIGGGGGSQWTLRNHVATTCAGHIDFILCYTCLFDRHACNHILSQSLLALYRLLYLMVSWNPAMSLKANTFVRKEWKHRGCNLMDTTTTFSI